MSKASKRPAEAIAGRYSPIPHTVLDSTAFMQASHPSKALLFELMRQHSGTNNGRLQLAHSWLSTRGWKSRDVIQRARDELLQRGLLVETKKGGLNAGPSWYALTWLGITNFVGLDIKQPAFQPGAWAFMDKLHAGKIASGVPPDGTASTARRDSTGPPDGTANPLTGP